MMIAKFNWLRPPILASMIGPIFYREAAVTPRRPGHFILRTVYGIGLLLLICTAWLIITNTQSIRNVGDMARFGSILFQILAPLQLALIVFVSATRTASAVAIEKDRQTLILLLMSRLTNSELVLGKLLASLLNVGVMLLTSLPIFMLIVLFGGTSFAQVGWSMVVTAVTALAAGSLAVTIALWREKTFQTLALVAMSMVFGLGAVEGLALAEVSIGGISGAEIAAAANPFRAILAASHPTVTTSWPQTVLPFLISAVVFSALLCGVGIALVRVWNPDRDVKPGKTVADDGVDMITGKVVGADEVGAIEGDAVGGGDDVRRDGHVDARLKKSAGKSRRVWDNPILWREICTWAYGRKILFIRGAYWLLAGLVFFALIQMVGSGAALFASADAGVTVPITARPLAPFMLLSLVMANALAVTSITTERDGRAMDLLQVTDLSPREFLFGKLIGVLVLAADMILLPLLMCGFLWYHGVISTENLVFLFVGSLTLNVFVVMLGIHCGMSYDGSRQAIGASLGTVFFLFLGVVTSMIMMISFTGSVEAQLAPFLACLIGGGIGLFLALGRHTPSPAIALGSALLPLVMFFSITNLLLEKYLSVLIALVGGYGFTTWAMMMPRLSEFLVASDRSRSIGDG